MDRGDKIRKAASLLAGKYGGDAIEQARRHARECSDRDNHEACREWLDVIAVLLEGAPERPAAGGRDARLAEVLDGAVTRQVMEADGVDREHVETIMVEKARHRRS
jgi:hypothetical protein